MEENKIKLVGGSSRGGKVHIFDKAVIVADYGSSTEEAVVFPLAHCGALLTGRGRRAPRYSKGTMRDVTCASCTREVAPDAE